MDFNNYCVYIHICPNGERYVGITSQQPNKRWINGNGYKGQWFYNAILKIGWDNIQHEIIKTNLSKKEAEEIEIKLIKQYETWCPGKGYNDTLGGKSRASIKPVKVLDLGIVFTTAKRASEYLNVPIYGVLQGGERYGHIFEWASEENCDNSDLCIY